MSVQRTDRDSGRGVRRARAGLRSFLDRLLEHRVVWVVLFLLTVTPLVLESRLLPEPEALPAGSIAPRDVVAQETREFVDGVATREARAAASASVRPLFLFDSRVLLDAASAMHRQIDHWRRRNDDPGQTAGGVPPRDDTFRLASAAEGARSYLASVGFDPATEDRLHKALRTLYQRPILGSLTLFPAAGGVTLRDTQAGREWDEDSRAGWVSLEEARRMAPRVLREAGAGEAESAALVPFLQDLVTPNTTLNNSLTEARRQEAEIKVEPLLVRVPRGKVLLRRGEVVGEGTARMLLSYIGAGAPSKNPASLVGLLLLEGLLLVLMVRYPTSHRKKHGRERHLFAILTLVLAISLSLDRGFLWLFDHLVASIQPAPFTSAALYRFMIPLATGAMLITFLLGARVGMAYTLFQVPLFGMMIGFDPQLMMFDLISNVCAVYGVSSYQRRTAPIQAGLVLGGINAAAVLALLCLPGMPPAAPNLIVQVACGFGGGILTAVLVSFLLPILESMFNVLTHVRLLELSNLDNPLLRRLAVEAPGSYNHSVIVGTLAEAAAEAIDANALFCRVAAYYHDVGKLLKPGYYIENQRQGRNRHDRLSPHLSALVITSHVKEGYELAKRYGIPQEVLDIIPQHHGTRRINFFYQKALQTDAGAGEVQETDFRYPGPKPQTKEAAIFMLSDSIEAAARTLEDPSPARFKGLIRRIVSDVVLDDQLDQSDLTFSDLDRVESAFLRTLSSIYHHRIDYPGFDFERIAERPFRGSPAHAGPNPVVRPWGR